ncbi:uncharacterized protein E0L32_006356 [Thyridium curvatum]|uniref:Uncharacterized protein n=1 Tax=Thyridium curvatum TaxID=1093900 RepID=A0A507B257_9PEZI|nr:uncharacterized protein E0L32_006356 [Thyridium curvatum]TPX13156.1 hypothetical protein E0L32_006356 [Thyridium curvatum]
MTLLEVLELTTSPPSSHSRGWPTKHTHLNITDMPIRNKQIWWAIPIIASPSIAATTANAAFTDIVEWEVAPGGEPTPQAQPQPQSTFRGPHLTGSRAKQATAIFDFRGATDGRRRQWIQLSESPEPT